jgi:hypothetical protein
LLPRRLRGREFKTRTWFGKSIGPGFAVDHLFANIYQRHFSVLIKRFDVMQRWLKKSFLIVTVFGLFGAAPAQPVLAAVIVPPPATQIDGSYEINPSQFNGSAPVNFLLTSGAVTSPNSLAGANVSDLPFTLTASKQVLFPSSFSPQQLTIQQDDGEAQYTINSPPMLVIGANNTGTISFDMTLDSNSLSTDFSALDPALMTIQLSNANFDAQWPVDSDLPVTVTFSITPFVAPVVPEPSSLALFLTIGVGGGILAWRRRRQAC